jgi:hypothetical protein
VDAGGAQMQSKAEIERGPGPECERVSMTMNACIQQKEARSVAELKRFWVV